MNIIFLDYDGVVNIPVFDENGENPRFNFPNDNKVNHFQGVCWLNRLCEETEAKIVVTSTWRLYKNYKECLYNGGLHKNIEILGKTEELDEAERGTEIQKWLDNHKTLKIDNFIILDDAENMLHLENKRIRTHTYIGINWEIYEKAKNKLMGISEEE